MAEERDMQFETILQETGKWVSTVVQLPYQMSDLITNIKRGRLQMNHPEIDKRLDGIQRQNRRIVFAIIFGSFLFSSIQLFSLQHNVLSIVSLVIAIIFLLFAIRPR
ncbi:MAG: hypothetical protein GWO41_11705 [candidate division Zixibacteria bacterium]|nr:hypothetical protein [candidate division Zixibacteria bacterium]NIW44146.1 hypothetical protein [Gammaproteobacteria bacterium]NIR63218.1 hypothetical protein [candidate division Zixibacteria bacterium]NIS45205.1 hypothetical protein [candidate division Zixibacteria bacterium]NIT53374.1 hypothetical protein [candidate division Zixibacteria bacterium]